MKKVIVVILTMLSALALISVPTVMAAGTMTLTVHAEQSSVCIGDEITFTVRMSDASATDLCAFAFKVSLPEGLEYKHGTAEMATNFQSTTGMVMTVFDEEPFLMASGFGINPYNGGEIDVGYFTCTATAIGQMNVMLTDVELLNESVNAISFSVVSASITVETDNLNDKQDPAVSSSIPENDYTQDETDREQSASMTEWENPFADVLPSSWYYEAVKYVFEKSIMQGTGNGFEPYANLNRAMLVQMLYNLEGQPATGMSSFDDVANNTWYANAVAWASENSIVNGIGNNLFAPSDDITREQMAVMLHNYCAYKGAELPTVRETGSFADNSSVSSWATEAVESMCKAGILSGKGDGIFDPQGKATRAEVAQMFMNFMEAMK